MVSSRWNGTTRSTVIIIYRRMKWDRSKRQLSLFHRASIQTGFEGYAIPKLLMYDYRCSMLLSTTCDIRVGIHCDMDRSMKIKILRKFDRFLLLRFRFSTLCLSRENIPHSFPSPNLKPIGGLVQFLQRKLRWKIIAKILIGIMY